MLLSPWVQDVPLEKLRHDTKPIHLAEGFGGQPIEFFPPYRFFRLYQEQRYEEARDQFRAWYREQFRKYSSIGKNVGGMRKGSLYRLVAAEHSRHGLTVSNGAQFKEQLVENAIAMRVEQRLELLAAISKSGYDPKRADTVVGLARSGGAIYLTGGHHRAAALKAIGEKVLPGVIVLSPRMRYVLKRIRLI